MSTNTVPSPTIRGTYNTYEDRTRKDLIQALGHVVDLELEKMVQIEVGGWGTTLKIKIAKGVNMKTKQMADGSTMIYLARE